MKRRWRIPVGKFKKLFQNLKQEDKDDPVTQSFRVLLRWFQDGSKNMNLLKNLKVSG